MAFSLFLNFSDTNLVPVCNIIFLGSLYSEYRILPLHSPYHWELVFAIYNAQIVSVINNKDVSSNKFPWPTWYFMTNCCFLVLCFLEIKTCQTTFNCLVCQYPCWSSRWICMSVALSFLYPYDSSETGSILFFGVMLVLLFFYLPWWFYHLSQSHLWMTIMAVDHSIL